MLHSPAPFSVTLPFQHPFPVELVDFRDFRDSADFGMGSNALDTP